MKSNNKSYDINNINFDSIIPGDVICRSSKGKEHLEVIVAVDKSNKKIKTISSNTYYSEK